MDAPHGYYANGGTANYNPYGYQGYPQPPAGMPQQAGGAQVMDTTPPSTGDAANKKRKVGGKRANKASVASMAEIAPPAAGLDPSLRSGYAVPSAGSAPDYGAISAATAAAVSHVPSMAAPAYNDPFANVTRGLDDSHKQELSNYWQATISDMEENEHDFKTHSLPLARIKKVMKADEDVKMISAEAPVLFAKGCEIFITELTMRAWIHAEQNKRRTLQRSDIANAIGRSDMFDFLIDIVPREEFVANRVDDSAGGGGAQAAGGSATAGSAHSGVVEEAAKVGGPPQQGYPSMTIGNGHDGGMSHAAMYAGAYAGGAAGAGQPQQQGVGAHDPSSGMHDPRAQFLYRQQQSGVQSQQQQQQQAAAAAAAAGQAQHRNIPPGYAQYAPQAHPYYMDSMYNPYVGAGGGGQQQAGAPQTDGSHGQPHPQGHPHQQPHAQPHAHGHGHGHGHNIGLQHNHSHGQGHAHPQMAAHQHSPNPAQLGQMGQHDAAAADGRLGSAGRVAGSGYYTAGGGA